MARLRRDGAFVGPDQAKRTWFAKTAIKQYEVQLRSSELVFSETRTGAEAAFSQPRLSAPVSGLPVA